MGDDGFAAFFRDTYPRVVGQLRVLTGDLAGAEDVAQEAFVRAASRWGQLSRYEQPEAWVRFDVTKQQLDLITSRLLLVLCRQGLWKQGVGFGLNFNEQRTRYWVVIHPGFSGLTARQILDRFLGRAP